MERKDIMNERIRQLSEQARHYAASKPVDQLKDRDVYLNNLFEKFAELIVKECMRAVESNRKEPREGYNTYNMGTFEAVDSIKQHFGIEE